MPTYDVEQFRQAYDLIASRHSSDDLDMGKKWNFKAKTWDKFDLSHNIGLILTDAIQNQACKDIISTAIFVWMIDPLNRDFFKSSIAVEVLKILSDIEEATANEEIEVRFFADLISRVTRLGPRFYKEIYYEVGGLSDLTRLSYNFNMKMQLNKRKSQIDRVLLMMKILHFAATELKDRKYYNAPSQNLAISGLNRIGPAFGIKVGLSETSARNWWKSFEPSMILLYAADQVRVPSRVGRKPSSLLKAVLGGGKDFYRDKIFFEETVARANYLKELFSNNGSDTFMKRNRQLKLPMADSIGWNAEFCNSKVEQEILSNFKKQ